MKEYTKFCPECNTLQTYKHKWSLVAAIKNNRWCNSCRQTGERNPNFGKYPSEETRLKISQKATGRPRPPHSEETRKKMSESAFKRKRKPHSDEAKRNMRLARLREIEEKCGQLMPNYSPSACKIIDEYGAKHGYNFQHAENGGEHRIKELGYWVDGYDEDKNVVIEYYESRHKYQEEKDDRRQREIVGHLGCKFIILRESNAE